MNGNCFNPEPDIIWAFPTIVTPENSIQMIEEDNLLERSIATDLFLSGKLSIDDFFDYLDGQKINLDNYLDMVEGRLLSAYKYGVTWL